MFSYRIAEREKATLSVRAIGGIGTRDKEIRILITFGWQGCLVVSEKKSK